MKSKLTLLLIVTAFTLGMWSCKDQPPVTPEQQQLTPGVTHIIGSVYDTYTNDPIFNAAVYLTTNQMDSFYTSTDGKFLFDVDRSKIQNTYATLSTRKIGYIPDSRNISVAQDTVLSVGLSVDMSSLAVITGIVRDSSTYLYPLRNATVLLTVPGYVDSAITPKEGNFRMLADLIDRDSVQVTLTIYKTGYVTKRMTFTVYKGRTKDFGDRLLSVDKASTVTQIFGRVFDAQSKLPITNAMVTLVSNLRTDSIPTSFGGDYSFSIDLQGLPSLQGLLKVEKNGYKPQDVTFRADAGKTFSNDFYIERDTTTAIRDTSKTSLYARAIAFVSLSAREISVHGVGGTEASIVVWEARDSLGFPIDIDHRDTIEFKLIGSPVSGGAYVSPARSITNASGRVATTVNSGTISGVVQLIATLRRDIDGSIIQSTPVIITVNAGLPDQAHFSIGADQLNFAGYDWLAHTDGILVQVGDKYSNPVKVNTAVYFYTTGGVVTASGFTDATSHARVTLYSGKPLPILDPMDLSLKTGFPASYFGTGDGYLWVVAQSIGENSETVTDSIVLLMSASSEIFADFPANLHVDSGECVVIPVRISDRFGNPLAPGTRISTEVKVSPPPNTNWNISATGLPEDPLQDYLTRGPARTEFSLTICDATPGGTPKQMPFVVTIRVSGPNGNVYTNINGVVGP